VQIQFRTQCYFLKLKAKRDPHTANLLQMREIAMHVIA